MRWQTREYKAEIPMRRVGPVKIISDEIQEEVFLPLATLESPLWPSTHRGAKICTQAGGFGPRVVRGAMARSVLLEADTSQELHQVAQELESHKPALQQVVAKTSRFARLTDIHSQLVGSLLYLRLSY